jgi:hypothetical protein
MSSRRLYILVRKDLESSYRAVQAGHAVAEWLLHDHAQTWRNSTLIYLGVKDENSLVRWSEKLDMRSLKWVGFKEPDIGNELTALAVECDGKMFRNLKLL